MPVNFPFEGRGGSSKFNPVLAGGLPPPTLAPTTPTEGVTPSRRHPTPSEISPRLGEKGVEQIRQPGGIPPISSGRISQATPRESRARIILREMVGPFDDSMAIRNELFEMSNEWRRRLSPLRRGERVEPTDKTAQGTAGAVPFVSNVSATESPTKVDDRTLSLVSVNFDRPSDISNWAFARIGISGYKSNPNFVFIAEGSQSPVSFLLESTNETIVIAVGSMNGQGKTNDIDLAPTTAVDLDGVVSAPPNPTISQNLVGLPLGFQFQFTQLAGLTSDVVDSYRIYRHTADVSGSSSLIQTIKHNPLNAGSITVQDFPGANLTRYYWVSAVNLVGLESSLIAAHTGATTNTGIGAGDSDLDLDDVPNTATRFAAVEVGANKTETRTAAAIAGQGALATKSAVDLATAEVTNKTAANIAETGARKWLPTLTRIFVTAAKKTAVEGLESGGSVATNKVVEASLLAGAVAVAKLKAETLNRIWLTQAQKDAAVDSSGNLLLKNIDQATGVTNGPTTTSTSWLVIAEMTKTITTKGNDVLILFRSSFQRTVGTNLIQIAVFRDTTLLGTFIETDFPNNNETLALALTHLDLAPPAASHVYTIKWKLSGFGATVRAIGTLREMQITELG